jgi:hypothetical protein
VRPLAGVSLAMICGMPTSRVRLAVKCQWQNLDKEFATCAIPLVSTSELSVV